MVRRTEGQEWLKNGKVPPQQHRKRMTSLKFKLIAAIPTMTKQQ